jgi:hypothetical protein
MVAPMSGLAEFLSIAWPGLLALAGFVALIVHAAREHRRRHPRGRWRVRFEGPLGVLTAEHELTAEQAAQVREVARRLVGEPLREQTAPRPVVEARGANAWAHVGWDEDGYVDDAGMYRSRRHPGRAG